MTTWLVKSIILATGSSCYVDRIPGLALIDSTKPDGHDIVILLRSSNWSGIH
jgi:hypothetical protein